MKRKLLLVSFLLSISTSPLIAEQSSSDKPTAEETLEVIMVKARKREEPINKVPIAIAALSGQELDEFNISSLSTATSLLPGVTIGESGSTTNLFIRGIGSGVNQGFEQSVGLFVDDVYYGRHYLARASIFDVEQVEVLKSPQTTLFGKNTIAGAVNIATKQPEFEHSGFVDVRYTPEFEEHQLSAAYNHQVSSSTALRAAINAKNSDGYMFNDSSGKSTPNLETFIGRVSVYHETDNELKVTAKFELNSTERNGRNSQISEAGTWLGLFQLFNEKEDGEFNDNTTSGGEGQLGKEYFKLNADVVSLKLEKPMWGGELVSISSVLGYDMEEDYDTDSNAIPLANTEVQQDYEQASQELRWYSPTDDEVNYLMGIFLLREDLQIESRLHANLAVLQLPFQFTNISNFDQLTKSFSAFGYLDWQFKEHWNLAVGLRYSDEEKDLVKTQIIAELLGDTRDETSAQVALATFAWNEHEIIKTRDEDHWMPSISISREFENSMAYLTYNRGAKAGGFDAFSANGTADNIEYDDEHVTALELGIKVPLKQGDYFNLSVFKHEFTDLQVSTYDGVANFNVGNAATSIAKGIELENRWSATENTKLITVLNYLDAYYSDYSDAPCNAVQNQQSPGGCTQNLNGKETQFSPKWSASVNFRHSTDIYQDYYLTMNVIANYRDRYALSLDLDENMFQDSFVKWDARIDLTPQDGDWTVAVIGENLSNERVSNWGNDVPILSGAYFRQLDKTRSVTVQFRYDF